MRYIDADIAKEKLKEYCIDDDNTVRYWYDLMGIDDCIDKIIPTADVVERSSYESMEHTVAKLNEALSNSVEVVRCKDCVYREVKGEGMTHWFGCRIMEHNDDDWYCSFGERRE